MNKQTYPFKLVVQRFTVIVLIVIILVSCEILPSTIASETTQTTIDPSTDAALAQPLETEVITPPALPEPFQTPLLNPLDVPRTYAQDTCRYLRNKWNPLNAGPGTVVMVMIINKINKGTGESPDGVNIIDLIKIMDHLKAQGFETVATKQLIAFMERNIKIPARSVVIIQNGNYDTEYFEKYFGGYYENWGWTIINGWVSEPNTPEELWLENIALERQGWVDHQAQGVLPDTKLSDDSAKAVIARELEGPLNTFLERYQKKPQIIIWPNGGFGLRPIEAARLLGYRLGFTANARGPVMYNWVPLADEFDPQRPSHAPEGRINDPLMTLPSYTPNQVLNAIDVVRATGKEAAAYAEANKEVEHEYYRIVCEADYGRMPTP
ncbi:MAG: hypothetical protein QY332_20440 [Anaerolineales bacterium]|nr:MAG: hypothetical protein QY332_20440 [Anaerolineales bacterium]